MFLSTDAIDVLDIEVVAYRYIDFEMSRESQSPPYAESVEKQMATLRCGFNKSCAFFARVR